MNYTASIIGLGNIAWKYDYDAYRVRSSALTHLSAYNEEPNIKVIGGFDVDSSQREQFSKSTDIIATDSLEALLDLKPDIVSICSPHQYHFHQLRKCIEANTKMIWLEKPATSNCKETQDIIDFLSKSGGRTRIAVGFQRRYLPAYRNIKNVIDQSTYGAVRAINLTYSRGLEINGSHLLDLLFLLAGNRDDYKISVKSNIENETNTGFVIDFNDFQCVVTGVPVEYHSIDVTVHFEQARLSVLHGGSTEVLERKIPNELFPGFFRLSNVQSETKSACQLDKELRFAFKYLLDDLVRSYEQNTQPLSNMESSLHSQILLDRLIPERNAG